MLTEMQEGHKRRKRRDDGQTKDSNRPATMALANLRSLSPAELACPGRLQLVEDISIRQRQPCRQEGSARTILPCVRGDNDDRSRLGFFWGLKPLFGTMVTSALLLVMRGIPPVSVCEGRKRQASQSNKTTVVVQMGV